MWGTCSPEQICNAVKEMGYRRLALTDTDNLYGLWPFLAACRNAGIEPIVGAELTDPDSEDRVVCLVENRIGYRNLCRLITRRHADAPFDFKAALISHSKGLVILVRTPELLEKLVGSGVTVAAALSDRLSETAFRMRRLAGRLHIPAAVVPGSFFLEPEDFQTHRMLRAIDLNTSLSRLGDSDTVFPDSFLASPEVYFRRFAAWPDALAGTEKIAGRLAFTGPDYGIVMPPWAGGQGSSARDMLRTAAYEGAFRRYGHDLSETVVERLEHELSVIEKKGFSSYFLVVQDIVSQSPRICGRGSGAASLVAYCLGITNVCPIKHNLYFERFLNPGRSDPPDIDVDFAWDERDAVLDSVFRKYPGCAAMVCNHVAFQPRMAIREVAKVFGLTDREIGQVSKRLPWFWKVRHLEGDLLSQLRQLPELGLLDFPEPWPEIIGIARRIIGIPRYLSVHPGGVVITPEPVDSYVPVEPAPKGVPVIQWEKDAAEEGGLVKIDLLGNRSLGVIRDAIKNIRENGIEFDEKCWEPEDDPATQKSVAQGHTMGCFYIESPATRLLQKKAKVGDFEHLVIHSSIIRPAANVFIREYVRRLHGGKWDPIHPLLRDVLNETYGIMVYQEDVSKTAVAMAGFSHADADGLRKILSKKDKIRRLRDYRKRFCNGAKERGASDKQIDAVWDMMMSFSGYSFCKPHSASYARVSFQAAYLKTHYPAEFMAAVISNQGGYYNTFAYVSEAKRMGVKILPPDVNESELCWKGNGRSMRVGLLSISDLGKETRLRIVAERKKEKYRDITDFLMRVKLEENEARVMIHAGAFDSVHAGESRASLLWMLACSRKMRGEKNGRQGLFGEGPAIPSPSLPPESDIKRLRKEFAILGFLCDRHPMELYREALKRFRIIKASQIHRFAGKRVRIAGLLVTAKVVHTKQGDPMEFLTFEDETGLVESVFFPETYRKFCAMIDYTRPFILSGKVEEDFGAQTLTVFKVETLSKLTAP
jgi:DNA polymerase-3 subunit alpha/error-prone DNA polymerase